jgi:hypothetical protein
VRGRRRGGQEIGDGLAEEPAGLRAVDVRREHHALAGMARPGAPDDVQRVRARQRAREKGDAAPQLRAHGYGCQPREQDAEASAQQASERREAQVQSEHQARGRARGHRLTLHVLDPEVAHPAPDPIGRFALGRRARKAPRDLREQADPVEGADLALEALLAIEGFAHPVRLLCARRPSAPCECDPTGCNKWSRVWDPGPESRIRRSRMPSGRRGRAMGRLGRSSSRLPSGQRQHTRPDARTKRDQRCSELISSSSR